MDGDLTDQTGPSPSDLPQPAWFAVHVRAGREFAAWRELRHLPGAELLFPVFGPRGRERMEAGIAPDADAILFPSYLLLRTTLTESVRKAVLAVVDVRHFVGARPDVPSPIPEFEIAVVRHVMAMERSPLLGAMPEKGRMARIVAGPMEGVTGLVTWRNKSTARIATAVRFAGGRSLEVTVPLELIRVGDYDDGGKPRGSRSRGGRRARRSREWHERHNEAA